MVVDLPSQDILDFCPVPVPGQRLLQDDRVHHFTRQGGEDLLEGADVEIRDFLVLGRVSLGDKKEVVHIDVYVLEAVERGCCAVISLVRPSSGGYTTKVE